MLRIMHWITPPPRIPPSIRSRAVLYGNRWLSWWASHRRPSRFPFILAHPSPRGNQQSVSILGIGDDDVVYLFIIYCLFTIYLSIYPSIALHLFHRHSILSYILYYSCLWRVRPPFPCRPQSPFALGQGRGLACEGHPVSPSISLSNLVVASKGWARPV
jgi:hypothetical protein